MATDFICVISLLSTNSTIVRSGNICTVVFSPAFSQIFVGDTIVISGATPKTFNGTFVITEVVSNSSVKYAQTGTNESATAKGATGGHYSSVSAWESAVQANPSSAAVRIVGHGAITISTQDFLATETVRSGANTGVFSASNGSQMLLTSVSGAFTAGMVITGDSSGASTTVTVDQDAVTIIGELHDNGTTPYTNVVIGGWGNIAAGRIGGILRPAPKHGHRDFGTSHIRPGAAGWIGAFLSHSGSGSTACSINQSGFSLQGIGVRQTSVSANSNALGATIFGDTNEPSIISSCVIEANSVSMGLVFNGYDGGSAESNPMLHVRNCIIYSAGIGAEINMGGWIANCTIVRIGALAATYGIQSYAPPENKNVTNTAIYGFPNEDLYLEGGTNAGSNVATEDTTGGITGLTASDFTSATDFRPAPTSTKLVNTGVNLTNSVLDRQAFTTDITGYTRPASGAWEIGAWEIQGAPPTGVKKIYLGATQVQTLNLGGTPIVSVYVGATKVFGP